MISTGPNGRATSTLETRNRALTILHLEAEQVYFGSGAHDAGNPERDDAGGGPSALAVGARFLDEMAPTLSALATVPYPALTHSLLETLETFIAADPKLAFRLATETFMQSDRSGGYHFESMGKDLFLKIAHRYLADYGGRLDSQPELVRSLDELADAGWPDALRLVYELP